MTEPEFIPSKKYQRLFNSYNQKYFQGKLPQTEVGFSRLLRAEQRLSTLKNSGSKKEWKVDGNYGTMTEYTDGTRRIALDLSTAKFDKSLTQMTLLHEMIHIKLSPYVKHGLQFRKEIRRIAALGAFDTLI